MADLSTPAVSLTAGGLALFGVATGLDPGLLIAGFIGGLWAQTYQDATTPWRRMLLTLLASILSAYCTPALATWAASYHLANGSLSYTVLQFPAAVVLGLLVHTVIGPFLIKWGTKRAEDATK